MDKADMTAEEAAKRFGYSKAGWDKKTMTGASNRALSIGEYELLLLLAGAHPDYELMKK